MIVKFNKRLFEPDFKILFFRLNYKLIIQALFSLNHRFN